MPSVACVVSRGCTRTRRCGAGGWVRPLHCAPGGRLGTPSGGGVPRRSECLRRGGCTKYPFRCTTSPPPCGVLRGIPAAEGRGPKARSLRDRVGAPLQQRTVQTENGLPSPEVHSSALRLGAWGWGRDALEGKGPLRRPQQRLGRRLEEVAKAVGGGYCRLQTPLKLALAVRGTVAGHGLGALEGGYPPFQCIPGGREGGCTCSPLA